MGRIQAVLGIPGRPRIDFRTWGRATCVAGSMTPGVLPACSFLSFLRTAPAQGQSAS